MKNVLMLLLLAVIAMGGCGGKDSLVNTPPPLPETPDASIVVANCAVLQAAVEQFAGENDGAYPDNVDADTSLAGHTVLDLLPAGGFENPFTGSPSAPVNGAADSPGEVGYVSIAEDKWKVGYVVTGFGADALVASLSNLGSPEEAKVIANCFIVKQTAEDQYDPYVGYPYERVCHPIYRIWLPHPLVDPYTGLVYKVLVPRAASSKGEIGYVAIVKDGVVAGYVVTGYGDDGVVCVLSNFGYSRQEALVAAECRRLQIFVENYADTHESLFPESAAALPGVSYESISMNGWNVGYRIAGSAQGSEFIEMATSPQEVRVRLNCLLLKQAVEESAAQNEGVYPENVDKDRMPGGSVVDLLPRAHLLENPYSGKLESPVNHSATRPGEIGYAAIPEYHAHCPWCGAYVPPGYVITGYVRRNRQIVVTNLKVSTIDAIVMSHCRTLQIAVEEFAARNDGLYPSDVDADCTPYGYTVTDLLPDGNLLLNPVIWYATEPVNGEGFNSGQIGYMPMSSGGYNRGYVITGTGTEDGTIIMSILKEPPDFPSR